MSSSSSTTTLNNEDYIICSFGPEYYRGVAWGSAITLLGVLAFMKRSHRQGMLNVEKAIKSQTSDKIQQKIDILEKYASSPAVGKNSASSSKIANNPRVEFQKEQIAKAKSMYNVDMYSWTMVRVGAIAATLKVMKFFLSWRRYSEFMFEEEYAREMSRKILDDAMANLAKEEEEIKLMEAQAKSFVQFESELTPEQKKEQKQQVEKRKRELQKVRDAIMIQALDDFRNVVELEKEIVNFNNSAKNNNKQKQQDAGDEKLLSIQKTPLLKEDNSHLVIEMNDRLNTRTGQLSSNSKMAKTRRSAATTTSENNNYNGAGDSSFEREQVMPTFWDGFSVGVWGSLIDADVPQKRVQMYLGLRAGKDFW